MNPAATGASSLTEKIDPTTIVHVVVIGLILIVLYHFAFHR